MTRHRIPELLIVIAAMLGTSTVAGWLNGDDLWSALAGMSLATLFVAAGWLMRSIQR